MAFPVSFQACIEYFVSKVSTNIPALQAVYEGGLPDNSTFPYAFFTTRDFTDFHDQSKTASYAFDLVIEVVSTEPDITQARSIGQQIAALFDPTSGPTGPFTGGMIDNVLIRNTHSFHGPNNRKHVQVILAISTSEP